MKARFSTRWRFLLGMPVASGVLVCVALAAAVWVGQAADASPEAASDGAALLFIENVGQFDPKARFLLRGDAGMAWLTEDAIWITALDAQALHAAEERWLDEGVSDLAISATNLRLSFVGANPVPVLEPFGRLDTRISYLVGDEPGTWQAAVPVWAGVRYRDLYPGIDLVLSADAAPVPSAPLPWRLDVREGADLSAVELRVEGARSLEVQGTEMQLGTGIGAVLVSLPGVSGDALTAMEIASASEMTRSVSILGPESFAVPVPLTMAAGPQSTRASSATADLGYGSYLGGSDLDGGEDVAIDGTGAIYVVGRTQSADFPTVTGSYSTTLNSQDAFVSKIDPAGAGDADLVYSTFLGGAAFDAGNGIAVSDGEAYITGYTASGNFPTTPSGAFDHSCGNDGGCDGHSDGFFAQLNADGTALVYASYLGGGNQDNGTGIAVAGGAVYLSGMTKSDDFPTTAGAYDRTCGTDSRCNPSAGSPLFDAFFVRLTPAGQGQNDLVYGTFLGGSDRDVGYDVAVGAGDAYVTGRTSSYDFPGTGYAAGSDAFALRIDPAGSHAADLVYSTLLGGGQWDAGSGIGVSGSTAFVTGETESADFPVTTGSYLGGTDAFLVQLDGAGGIDYAAYVGGTGLDRGHDLVVDKAGAALLTGYTESADFPTTDEAYAGVLNGNSDAFVARVALNSSKPQHITYASYLGGSGGDSAYGLVVDDEGYASLAGVTYSSDFPTTPGAYGTALSGSTDVFVAKLLVTLPPALDVEKTTNGLDADEPPGLYLLPGDPVTWQYIVTNTGDYVLSNIVLTDDPEGPISCPDTSLQPSTSMMCSANGTAGEGQYANLATATGTAAGEPDPVVDTDLSHYFGAVPQIDLEKHTQGEDVDGAPGPMIRVGEVVTWTYLVTNTGNVHLSSISVTDSLEGVASCPYDNLAPHQSMTCTLTGTVATGQYANVANATGSPPGGLSSVSDADPSHYFGADPSVAIEKRTNGYDADAMPGPSILAGDTVTWTYLVTNTGNVPLSGIVVSDDKGVAVTCSETELAVEASATCTATGVAIAGQYTNTGTVMATPPVGTDVSAQDVSHYFGVYPELAIEKQTNGDDADMAPGPFVEEGGAVAWTYLVTNRGNVSLSNVTVVDDQGVTVDCPGSDLVVDGSMICSAGGAAVSGQYSNTGVVTGTPPLGPDVMASDLSHYYGSTPGIAVEKRTNGEDADAVPGPYVLVTEAVTWTYVVSNTGNVTLSDIMVRDDQPGVAVECPGTTVAVSEAMTCTATSVSVAGQYTNTGVVTGTPPVGAKVSASDLSHYYGAKPELTIEKRTNGEDADTSPGPTILAGEPVTWTYLITNSGNVTLTDIIVADDRSAEVVCLAPELAVSATMTCTATGIAEVGPFTNTGTVTGTPPGGLAPVWASDPSHYYGAEPDIAIQKRTNGEDANIPTGPTVMVGTPVNWEYIITNEGNVPLADIEVTDSDVTLAVACPKTSLAASDSMVCTASGVAETGQYSNTGTATGSPPDGLPSVSDSDPSHYLGINPAIALEKHTNGQDADEPPGPYIPVGEPVTWTYHVTNTGDILLLDVAVSDDPLGPVFCDRMVLAVGEAMTCTATSVAAPGQYGNEATVTAAPLGNSVTVSDADASHYFGAELALNLEKLTNGQDADAELGYLVLAGGTVTWTYAITNSSNVTLTGVSVSDDRIGSIDCPLSVLAPDQSMSCTETGTAEVGQYANVGSVNGIPPGGLEAIGDSDPGHYYGAVLSLSLVKRTNGQDADSPPGPYIWESTPVTWTYLITNTGNITLTGVTVVDDQRGEIDCPGTTLVASETMTCTVVDVAGLGQYTNTAVVTGTSPLGSKVMAQDSSHYFGIAPAIETEKHTNGEDADEPPGPRIWVDQLVEWTYIVTNTGDITLTHITVSDDQGVAVECPKATLASWESMTCTASGAAVLGQYANVGTASGEPPGGPKVTAGDPSHYLGRGLAPAIDVEKYTNGQDADMGTGPYVPVGDPVTWEYVVTNLGNVDLITVTVVDDRSVEVTCPGDTLRRNQSMTCEASGTAEPGQYSNTATVTATAKPEGVPPVVVTDTDPSHYYGSEPDIQVEKLTNGEDADVGTGPYILAGLPVTWTYLVSNTGNVALDGIAVVDDQGMDVSCPRTGLAAGRVMMCTATGLAAPGQYTNTATVTGTPPVGLDVTDGDPSHYFGVTLVVTFEKRTNGQDADNPPGPLVPTNKPITWTYHLTSASNVSLSVVVTDSQGVAVDCDDSVLFPGETITCTAPGNAVTGQYANTGTATLTPPGDLTPVVLTDTSHYFGSEPRIAIEKLTNGQSADNVPGPYVPEGQDVQWTYEVTNTGNITLVVVSVADDQGVEVSCPQDILAPREDMTCEATGLAIAGQYENTGIVTGTPPVGDDLIATDPSHYFGSEPGIALSKRTVGEDADDPPGPTLWAGETVTWTYLVSNTGNVLLEGVVVADDQGLDLDCPKTVLAPREVMTCTASGLAEAGQHRNIGTARGTPPVGNEVSVDDPSHYFAITPVPAVAIEKRTNGHDADVAPGPYVPVDDGIQWIYLVSNPGNMELTNVTVTDDQFGPVACPKSTLASGETMECEVTGTALPGQYSNTGTVTGTTPIDTEVRASDHSHYYGIDPGIDLEKWTNGQNADDAPGVYIVAGNEVRWTYRVTNTGNITLTHVLISDDQEVGLSCPATTLGPDEATICTATGIAGVGPYANLGTVTGTLPTGDSVSDSDPSHYFGVEPGIEMNKYTNGEDADEAPGPMILETLEVNWTYVVTNTGDVELTEVAVADDQGVEVSCPQTTLAVSEVMTCTASGVALQGQYANLGLATGTHAAGASVMASDPSHYLGFSLRPAIDVQKRTNGLDADQAPGPYIPEGEAVQWEYLVSNVGNVELVEVTVEDDQEVVVSCPGDRVRPGGAPLVCTGSGIAEAGQYGNIATATGIVGLTGEVITDTDPSHYFGSDPGIELQKLTNGQDADEAPGPGIAAGQPVTWTYLVTNTGNVTLTQVIVVDDQGVEVDCPATTLGAGQPMTCTANGIAQLEQYRNVGSVTAYFGDVLVMAADPSHYHGLYTIYLPLITHE